jgi:hypothetical protein
VFTGRAARRTHRRGPACAVALAVLVGAGCAPGHRQPAASDLALRRVAAAVRHDVYGRPASLAPLLEGRALLYFFRTDCPHCAAGAAAALAARPGAPALVLFSREGPAQLRAALGPSPQPGVTVVSDSDGAVMARALPTLFVPRIVGVEGFAVRLDVTGDGLRLADAAAALTRRPR